MLAVPVGITSLSAVLLTATIGDRKDVIHLQEDNYTEPSQIPNVQSISSAFNNFGETLRKSHEEYIGMITKNLSVTLNGLSDSLREACFFPAISSTLLAENFREVFVASMNSELTELANVTSTLIQQLNAAQRTFAENEKGLALSNETVTSLQELKPLVPDEQQESFAEIVTPSKSKKLLSVENIKWLLGILIPMIFSLFLRALPDKDAEEANLLQAESNAILQTDVDLHQEDTELRREEIELFHEFFEYLKENGICIPAQVEGLPHDVQTIENDLDAVLDVSDTVQAVPDGNGQDDTGNFQP